MQVQLHNREILVHFLKLEVQLLFILDNVLQEQGKNILSVTGHFSTPSDQYAGVWLSNTENDHESLYFCESFH
jgi:hypothetical protein